MTFECVHSCEFRGGALRPGDRAEMDEAAWAADARLRACLRPAAGGAEKAAEPPLTGADGGELPPEAQATRDQLEAKAAALGLRGLSKLTKQQLLEAIAEAQAPAGPAA